MKVNPSEIFQVNPNGTFFVKRPIQIGGNVMDNVVFSSGVRVGGLDLASLASKKMLEVEDRNGVYIITAFYE